MKERLGLVGLAIHVVIALVLGAPASVGLAMWLARHSPTDATQAGVVAVPGDDGFPAQLATGFGVKRWSLDRTTGPVRTFRALGPVKKLQIPHWVDLPVEGDRAWLQNGEWIGAGWPRISFTASRTFDLLKLGEAQSTWQNGTVVNAGSVFQPFSAIVYPKKPVWSGVVINALSFGGALLVLIFSGEGALWLLRRKLRILSGRCRDCGYDLTGLTSNTCPECGGTLRSQQCEGTASQTAVCTFARRSIVSTPRRRPFLKKPPEPRTAHDTRA